MENDCDSDNEDRLKCLMTGVREDHLLERTISTEASIQSPEVIDSITRLSELLNTKVDADDYEKMKSLMTGVKDYDLLEIADSAEISTKKPKTKASTPSWKVQFDSEKRRADLIIKNKKAIIALLRATLLLYKEKEFFELLPHVIPFIEKMVASKKQTNINDFRLYLTPEETKLLNAYMTIPLMQTNWKGYLILLLDAMILFGEIIREIKK